jgi:alanine dehydrogenase
VRIGIPTERKVDESRVALTPAAVHVLVQDGHAVAVERGAGHGSGFADEDYAAAGARLVDREEAWAAELVLKVKEPQPEEYRYLRSDLTLFCYLHLAADGALTQALRDAGTTAVALETVQRDDGALPLLQPMSEIAGRMAVQVGAHLLQSPCGGRGVLVGGVPGVPPAHVVVVGGGTVGRGAARIAAGLGARVTVLEVSPERLAALDELFQGRVETLASYPWTVGQAVASADLVVGAVLVPGARAPHVVTEAMVRAMRPGAVVVDVAVDQGGCVETCDHPTTHHDPTYVRYGVVHYAVANMPGAVPRTATEALANATLPYVRRLAALGWRRAAAADPALARGVNVARGAVTCRPVAEAFGLPYRPVAELL